MLLDADQLHVEDQLGVGGDVAAGAAGAAEVREALPDVPEWSQPQVLEAEEKTLGLHLTSHPLDRDREEILCFANADPKDLGTLEDGVEITLGGLLSDIRYTQTRNGQSRGGLPATTATGSRASG